MHSYFHIIVHIKVMLFKIIVFREINPSLNKWNYYSTLTNSIYFDSLLVKIHCRSMISNTIYSNLRPSYLKIIRYQHRINKDINNMLQI